MFTPILIKVYVNACMGLKVVTLQRVMMFVQLLKTILHPIFIDKIVSYSVQGLEIHMHDGFMQNTITLYGKTCNALHWLKCRRCFFNAQRSFMHVSVHTFLCSESMTADCRNITSLPLPSIYVCISFVSYLNIDIYVKM